jgi:transcriptional accessory protein Tex/SPT6
MIKYRKGVDMRETILNDIEKLIVKLDKLEKKYKEILKVDNLDESAISMNLYNMLLSIENKKEVLYYLKYKTSKDTPNIIKIKKGMNDIQEFVEEYMDILNLN